MRLVLLLLLLLVAAAPSYSLRKRGSGETASGVDPRTLYPADFKIGETVPWVKFEVGKEYRYHFESKAAHLDSPLPNRGDIRPQAALEDLGVFPFAVLEGLLLPTQFLLIILVNSSIFTGSSLY